MFKSVFAKYVTAFMTIITFGFVILLLIVTSIVSHYSGVAKADFINQVAQAMQSELEDEIPNGTAESFQADLNADAENALDHLLDAFTRKEKDDLLFWVTDADGKPLYERGTSGKGSSAVEVEALPISEILAKVRQSGEYTSPVFLEERNQRLIVCAQGVYNAEGTLCGVAMAGSTNMHWGTMVEELTQTVITSALLVVLAALIAAYFITERTVQPLREMNHAARDFAKGNFERRVVVRGRDEVSELAEEFNQMAESLQNLESMRSSFIANVSHDLRTPMTTIAGFIDGIRDGVIPEEERDHYLELVSLEIQRLSRLVASLLDLSRIQAGSRKFVMQPFDICEMARVILISFEQQIEEKQLEVELSTDEDRMTVSADHDAIYQVLYNLCHNAVKFSRKGGLLRIRVTETESKRIEVSVYNEGEGIPKEDLPFVFERFYKTDKSRSLDKSGVGLGLYISKTIITAHGEKIWLASESGSNCEFFFTLSKEQKADES